MEAVNPSTIEEILYKIMLILDINSLTVMLKVNKVTYHWATTSLFWKDKFVRDNLCILGEPRSLTDWIGEYRLMFSIEKIINSFDYDLAVNMHQSNFIHHITRQPNNLYKIVNYHYGQDCGELHYTKICPQVPLEEVKLSLRKTIVSGGKIEMGYIQDFPGHAFFPY